MTIIMIGVCRNGEVPRNVSNWRDPRTGQVASGITYDKCEKCDGKGCPPAPAKKAPHAE